MNLPSTTSQYGKAASSISKIGSEIFIFGGEIQNDGNFYSDDVFKYDINTNNWHIVDEDLGKNRVNASGFYANGKIYVGSGEDSEVLTDFWEYDINTNQWSKKADLNSIHSDRSCVEINGKGYFVGGISSNISAGSASTQYTDNLVEYDPQTNLWTEKAPFPGGKRSGMVSLAYKGKLYAGLGQNTNGAATSDFYEYDPTLNSWKSLTSSPVAGSYLSYFVLNDAAYILAFLANNPTIVYKYDFNLNTWSTESCPILNGGGIPKGTNQAFIYDGKGYVVNSVDNLTDQLSEFDPTTGVWKKIMNLPSIGHGGTVITSTNGIYFGFGFKNYKIRNTNDWQELRINAGVSDKVGSYETSYNGDCGTGNLESNSNFSIYDEEGDLFISLITGSLTSNICVKVNSIDLNQNFRTLATNFGNGYIENGMFLNKSVLFENNRGMASPDILKLYYTTTELNKLVQDYNNLYSSNKTLQDIKLVQYFENNSNDFDPLNNANFVIYNPTLEAYGNDKYFEISTSFIGGEIYAVILSGSTLGNTSFQNKKISIYPNPSSTILNIQLLDNFSIDKIIITDLTGKKVKEQNGNSTTLNIENLTKGLYFLELFYGDLKLVHKFIKE